MLSDFFMPKTRKIMQKYAKIGKYKKIVEKKTLFPLTISKKRFIFASLLQI
jgi:hypothetical protein